MASYTRQSTFSDGDLITAALFNDEYNQLLEAFENTTGHKHDGTVGEGPVIGILGDAGVVTPLNKILIDTTNDHIEFWIDVSGTSTQQLYIADGAIVPVTDNDIDLGTSSLQFKDLYINGTANIDSLVADTADINGGTIDGTIIGGTSAAAITGTTITGTSFVIGSASIDETELEILDGATLTTTELNYVDGVTSSIQTQIDTKAPLASPSLTGIPTAPTAASNTNTTQIATTAYVQTEITELIAGAPGTLDTLNELAAAINDDANYNTTLTTALATKLPLAGGTMTGDVTYSDNVKAQFGTSNDLQIYHDGNDKIVSSSSYLILEGSNIILRNNGGTEDYAKFFGNGAVQLYSDNSLKLATTSAGINVTGVITTDGLTTSGDINFGDNDKAIFGAGGDLEIFHTGSSSIIKDSGTGSLSVRGTHLNLADSGGNIFIEMTDTGTGGTVEIKHNAETKLTTTSTGIDVTGTVTSDGLTVDGVGSLDNNGLNLELSSSNTGIIYDAQNGYHTFKRNGTNALQINGGTGDVYFYDDTGTTQSFFWDASAESLGLGTTSPAYALDLANASGGNLARFKDSDSSHNGIIIAGDNNAGWVGNSASNTGEGIYYQNSINAMRFYANGSEKARLNSTGLYVTGTVISDGLTVDGIINKNSDYNITHFYKADGSTRLAYILFRDDNPNYFEYNDTATQPLYFINNNKKVLGLESNSDISFYNAAGTSQALFWDASTERLGIGTTSPNQKLEIKTTSGTAGFRIHSDTTSAPRTEIEFMRGTTDTFGGDAYTDWKIGHTGSNQADFAIVSSDTTRGTNERVTIEYDTGNVGIGTDSPATALDVTGTVTISGDTLVLTTSKTPSSATDTGTTGQIAWDSDYIYVCVATNTWKRVAISTW